MFFCVPEAVPVTFNENEHEVPADSVAAERLTLFDPPTAVTVPPPQLPLSAFGVPTTCPGGKGSVKPILLRVWLVFGFDKLKVRVVVPFNATLAAPKAFVMAGGSTVGGGVDPAEDPPPQARFEKKLEVASKNAENRDMTRYVRVVGLKPVSGSFP
jgi:hypothetical protein